MSLDYNISKCDRKAAFNAEGKLSQVAYDLIWLTLAIEMGSITEKNYLEFFNRARLWQYVTGSTWAASQEDVKSMIGLTTNVPYKNTKYFDSKIARMLLENAKREATSKEFYEKLELERKNRMEASQGE